VEISVTDKDELLEPRPNMGHLYATSKKEVNLKFDDEGILHVEVSSGEYSNGVLQE
jgi:hypothetical protein